jgi:hypothetical protein
MDVRRPQAAVLVRDIAFKPCRHIFGTEDTSGVYPMDPIFRCFYTDAFAGMKHVIGVTLFYHYRVVHPDISLQGIILCRSFRIKTNNYK